MNGADLQFTPRPQGLDRFARFPASFKTTDSRASRNTQALAVSTIATSLHDAILFARSRIAGRGAMLTFCASTKVKPEVERSLFRGPDLPKGGE